MPYLRLHKVTCVLCFFIMNLNNDFASAALHESDLLLLSHESDSALSALAASRSHADAFRALKHLKAVCLDSSLFDVLLQHGEWISSFTRFLDTMPCNAHDCQLSADICAFFTLVLSQARNKVSSGVCRSALSSRVMLPILEFARKLLEYIVDALRRSRDLASHDEMVCLDFTHLNNKL